jgi:uncharacterized membrane protein YecN with MAPEG domain
MTATMPMTTAIYAAILGLLGAALTINVIVNRVRHKVTAGDGGVAGMAQAIRAHGNFIEQAPLALLLIAFAEAAGARPLVVNVLGAATVLGRLASAYALNRTLGLTLARQVGATLGILVLIGAAAAIFIG